MSFTYEREESNILIDHHTNFMFESVYKIPTVLANTYKLTI